MGALYFHRHPVGKGSVVVGPSYSYEHRHLIGGEPIKTAGHGHTNVYCGRWVGGILDQCDSVGQRTRCPPRLARYGGDPAVGLNPSTRNSFPHARCLMGQAEGVGGQVLRCEVHMKDSTDPSGVCDYLWRPECAVTFGVRTVPPHVLQKWREG